MHTKPLIALPVDQVLPDVLEALTGEGNAVLVAPPGSGKTTRVPPALLELPGLSGCVLVAQPRRVAVRLAAQRVAEEQGSRLGGRIGFSTRFESRRSTDTRVEFVTEGLLLRRIQEDPFLEGVGAVLLDEFHERSLAADMLLALARSVQREARPDLRIVVMSATLDPAPVADFLGPKTHILEAEGRTYPVELQFEKRSSTRPLPERVASAARRELAADLPAGSAILAFLPSVATVERCARLLRQDELPENVEVATLHGGLSAADQDRALRKTSGRKVVMATNIAETSVTLPGVVCVIDSGMEIRPDWDARVGLESLGQVRISRSSADQRAGRAGRTGPGRCVRLWTRGEDTRLESEIRPEVLRCDLASTLLQLAVWGERPEAFDWYQEPPSSSVRRAMDQLSTMGLIAEGSATPLGRAVSAFPLEPRQACVLLAGAALGILRTTAAALALMSGRPLFGRDHLTPPGEDDLSFRLRTLVQVESGGRVSGLRGSALRETQRVRDQLIRSMERGGQDLVEHGRGLVGRSALGPDSLALARALAVGYGDRLAKARSSGGERYLLASGLGARLSRNSGCSGDELLLALQMNTGGAGSGEAWIQMGLTVERSWVDADETEELLFDEREEAVVARVVRRVGAILLEARPSQRGSNPEATAECLAEAALLRGPEALLQPDKDESRLLGRVDTLRRLRPELELPDLRDRTLLIPILSRGLRSFSQLRKAKLRPAIDELLSWEQRRALDADLPESLTLPSGSPTRLAYAEDGSPPVLAARIQQLFGMQTSPRLAGGRQEVLVHLLAPNGRPAQVTRDLGSFWSTTWPEVRKELRGRYPKHSWPEDPRSAEPTDRARRKGKR